MCIRDSLNQIARYLNEYGVPYNTLSGEVRAAISDLAVLKYEAVSYTHLLFRLGPNGCDEPAALAVELKGLL